MSFELGADQIRTILHLTGAAVWFGGQIVLLGLLPLVREVGGDMPQRVAAAFGRIAWPAFGLLMVTGIWNLAAIDLGAVSSGYNAAFGIKMILVVVSGFAAAVHQGTESAAVRGATGAGGFAASVAAFVLGVGMSH